VESASVATALAKYDFPVPGGPYKRKALQGRLLPKESKWRIHKFSKTKQVKVVNQNVYNLNRRKEEIAAIT